MDQMARGELRFPHLRNNVEERFSGVGAWETSYQSNGHGCPDLPKTTRTGTPKTILAKVVFLQNYVAPHSGEKIAVELSQLAKWAKDGARPAA
jgi:hypothetical protein